ncbi:hypothetical protein [Streptomyces xylophagus]|uniref:hypothetical protein n=1 Tax=Streptomyces xylophagus TaxID=285514 RepID=UPI000A614F4F|nr:hypothetical protein [Streptomyces xylophagus]
MGNATSSVTAPWARTHLRSAPGAAWAPTLLVPVANSPLAMTPTLALRRPDPATSLREQGGE